MKCMYSNILILKATVKTMLLNTATVCLNGPERDATHMQ